MRCQAIQMQIPEIKPSLKTEKAPSKVTIRGLVEKYVRALTDYWRRQNASAYQIDRAVMTAREEIYLKYGHLMMK